MFGVGINPCRPVRLDQNRRANFDLFRPAEGMRSKFTAWRGRSAVCSKPCPHQVQRYSAMARPYLSIRVSLGLGGLLLRRSRMVRKADRRRGVVGTSSPDLSGSIAIAAVGEHQRFRRSPTGRSRQKLHARIPLLAANPRDSDLPRKDIYQRRSTGHRNLGYPGRNRSAKTLHVRRPDLRRHVLSIRGVRSRRLQSKEHLYGQFPPSAV
jgi:hypothetical protein